MTAYRFQPLQMRLDPRDEPVQWKGCIAQNKRVHAMFKFLERLLRGVQAAHHRCLHHGKFAKRELIQLFHERGVLLDERTNEGCMPHEVRDKSLWRRRAP